jgi:hypothetical protein
METIKELGEINVPNPIFGDVTLNVFPLSIGELPSQFEKWQPIVDRIMSHVPHDPNSSNEHCVTITSKFFTEDSCLRREGVHIDGNFCVDPNFVKSSWGGVTPRPAWADMSAKIGVYEPLPNNEHVDMDWVLPYDITIPVGEYVSSDKGGLLTISNLEGCDVWDKPLTKDEVGDGGDCSHLELSEDDAFELEAGKLYFIQSNLPHSSRIIKKGNRRTMIRVTLAHDYNNSLLKG